MHKNMEYNKICGSTLYTELVFSGEQEEISKAVLLVQVNEQPIFFQTFLLPLTLWPMEHGLMTLRCTYHTQEQIAFIILYSVMPQVYGIY